MTAFRTLLRLGALLPAAVAAVALFLLMVMTFADVVLRSAANAPIEAATELTRLLMAVVVFSMLPVVSARGDHIAVDLTDGLFAERAARLRDALLALACGAMLWWPAARLVTQARRFARGGDVTEYLAIPLAPVAWFIAVMLYVTMAVLILRGLILLVRPDLARLADDRGPA